MLTDQALLSPASINASELVERRRDARKFKLKKKKIKAKQSGGMQSRLRGRGMEFDEVRLYQPGDDVRNIDWRVTARTTDPHTKLFREERERPVMLCVDYRSNMHFATRGAFKSVIASHIAAIMAWAACLHGDNVGGFVFSNNRHTSIKAGRGKNAVLNFIHRLCEQHANEDKEITEKLSQSLSRLRRLTRPGSLVFIFSDFNDLDGEAEKHLIELSKHNEVTLVSIHDPLEKNLPQKGQYQIRDKSQKATMDTGKKATRLRYQKQFEDQMNYLENFTIRHHMRLIPCSTDRDINEQLALHMELNSL